jgi:c-di-GMP-binding flagellar brake protein YcgR
MSSEKHRASIRIEKRLPIEYSSNCPPIQAYVEDLSETGMYIDVDQALPAGETLEFTLKLPDADAEAPIKGSAQVVWSGPTGMGVEFNDLTEAARERIRFFVAAVHFDQPPDLPTE